MLGCAAMLGFLHGGAIHVETFEQLVQAAQPGVVTQHVVREDLLANAITAGRDTTCENYRATTPGPTSWPAI
jgi:hypothetical protein